MWDIKHQNLLVEKRVPVQTTRQGGSTSCSELATFDAQRRAKSKPRVRDPCEGRAQLGDPSVQERLQEPKTFGRSWDQIGKNCGVRARERTCTSSMNVNQKVGESNARKVTS